MIFFLSRAIAMSAATFPFNFSGAPFGSVVRSAEMILNVPISVRGRGCEVFTIETDAKLNREEVRAVFVTTARAHGFEVGMRGRGFLLRTPAAEGACLNPEQQTKALHVHSTPTEQALADAKEKLSPKGLVTLFKPTQLLIITDEPNVFSQFTKEF